MSSAVETSNNTKKAKKALLSADNIIYVVIMCNIYFLNTYFIRVLKL